MPDRDRERYYTDIISGLAERTIRRLWIANIVQSVLIAVGAVCWILFK